MEDGEPRVERCDLRPRGAFLPVGLLPLALPLWILVWHVPNYVHLRIAPVLGRDIAVILIFGVTSHADLNTYTQL